LFRSRDLQYGEAPDGAETFNAGKIYPENNEEIEFYITGIEPDSTLVILKDNKGNVIPNNQTNITKSLANRLGIKAGDTVTFINKRKGTNTKFLLMQFLNPTMNRLYSVQMK